MRTETSTIVSDNRTAKSKLMQELEVDFPFNEICITGKESSRFITHLMALAQNAVIQN